MSRLAILINPPPIIEFRQKIPYSSHTLKTSEFGYRKSVRLRMERILGSSDNEQITCAFEQETLIDNHISHHILFNKLSKWIVAVSFGGFLVLRHDAVALWAALGSVLNVILSVTLKQIFKQERPHSASGLNSGYGMPSSHAQSIFFTLVFLILSVLTCQGLNGVTATLCLPVVALGCYFAWLRSLLRYHTRCQVIVGAIVGSVFSVLWFLAWETIVYKAYNSSLWARILVIVGGACFCIGFFAHVIQHWLKEED